MIPIMASSRTTTSPGPEVALDCPGCSAKSVTALTTERQDRLALFWCIPISRTRTVEIGCEGCGKNFRVSGDMGTVTSLSAEELRHCIESQVTSGEVFTTILALVLSWVPGMGFLFAVIALFATWKRRGVWRILSGVALFLSLVATGALCWFFVSEM